MNGGSCCARQCGDLVDEACAQRALGQPRQVRVVDDRRHELAIRRLVGERRRRRLEAGGDVDEPRRAQPFGREFGGGELPDARPRPEMCGERLATHDLLGERVGIHQVGPAAALREQPSARSKRSQNLRETASRDRAPSETSPC